MEDINLATLGKLDRIAAPPDFEGRVMSALTSRRASLAQARRTRPLRYSLAGAAAFLLIGFLALNVFVPQRPDSALQAGFESLDGRDATGRRVSLPITEAMNYRREFLDAASAFNSAPTSASSPSTVYILERVSDSPRQYIKY
jgi:hypothetical protein